MSDATPRYLLTYGGVSVTFLGLGVLSIHEVFRLAYLLTVYLRRHVCT